MYDLIGKKGIPCSPFSWTPVQEAKASCKFGVLRSFRYESNRIVCFTKRSPLLCLILQLVAVNLYLTGIYLKSYRDFTSFSETQAKETWGKDLKTMKNENFKIPRHRFVKQTIPIWLISKWTQNSKLARRFSFLNWGVSSGKVSM